MIGPTIVAWNAAPRPYPPLKQLDFSSLSQLRPLSSRKYQAILGIATLVFRCLPSEAREVPILANTGFLPPFAFIILPLAYCTSQLAWVRVYHPDMVGLLSIMLDSD